VDFTIVSAVLAALLLAIPTVATYFRRETRKTRAENRRLRAIVQEFDLHCFSLERSWTARGQRPPPRPELLRVLYADDAKDDAPTVEFGRPHLAAGEASGTAAP
jgi:hypothetical protein